MKPLILITVTLGLVLSGCVSTPTPSNRSRLYDFVRTARAEHGTNARDWPPEVRVEFQRRYREVHGE